MIPGKKTVCNFLLLLNSIFSVICMPALSFGQEAIVNLQFNQVLGADIHGTAGKFLNPHPFIMAAGDTLDLPFVDDFSLNGMFPDQAKWLGPGVYVNNRFCVYPVTKGVGTFDGANHRGDPYDMTSVATYGLADS